jgi:hypothetical protein
MGKYAMILNLFGGKAAFCANLGQSTECTGYEDWDGDLGYREYIPVILFWESFAGCRAGE